MKLFFRFTLLAAAALFLTACGLDTNNAAPPSPLVTFTPTAKLTKVWWRNVGEGSHGNYLRLSLAVENNRLFTTDDNGYVVAVNATTGKEIWSHNLKTPVTSGVGVGSGLLLVGAANGHLYALDQQTGQLRWSTLLGNQSLATPSVGKGYVIVKTVDDQVFALDASTGKTLWTYASDAPEMILRFGSSPRIVQDKVVLGLANGKVVVLSLRQGTILWEQSVAIPTGATEIEQMVDIDTTPEVLNDAVYIATYQGNIASLQLDTGATIWRHAFSSYSGIALGQDNLFVTDANGHIWVFKQATGLTFWQQDKLAYRGLTAPALLTNYVVVGDKEGYLHVLSRQTGEFVARTQITGDPILSTPLVINNMVYALTSTGVLAAYRIESR